MAENRKVSERELQYLQDRGYGFKTVEKAQSFVDNFDEQRRGDFFAAADLWTPIRTNVPDQPTQQADPLASKTPADFSDSHDSLGAPKDLADKSTAGDERKLVAGDNIGPRGTFNLPPDAVKQEKKTPLQAFHDSARDSTVTDSKDSIGNDQGPANPTLGPRGKHTSPDTFNTSKA